MSKDEGGRNSSFSEKPVRSRLRRLVDWINLTGAKKVHSLIDKIYKRKNLEMAWERVKGNRGSGGVDGQSLEAFEAQLNQQLDRLHRELKEDTYRPLPVRQHPIPKRDKPGEFRMLGIPAVYDRVCQQALLNRLEPIFEPIFDDASFGYRRGRSTKDALRKIWKEIQDGAEWIVDADLRDFFGSVDHADMREAGTAQRELGVVVVRGRDAGQSLDGSERVVGDDGRKVFEFCVVEGFRRGNAGLNGIERVGLNGNDLTRPGGFLTELDLDFEIAVARYRQPLLEELVSDSADVKLDLSGCHSGKVESPVLIGDGIEGVFSN